MSEQLDLLDRIKQQITDTGTALQTAVRSNYARAGAQDVVGRQAGVGAIEGMAAEGRRTEPDFRSPDARRFGAQRAQAPASKRAAFERTLRDLRLRLQANALTPDQYAAEVRRAEEAFKLAEDIRSTSPGGLAPEYGRATSPGGITPTEAKPTSPGGITPTEAKPTFPGNNVLDAPSGPREPALRLTEPGVNVSQNYQATRATTPGEPLQRARQALRVADPEFSRATEPFTPGTRDARLYEGRSTVIDRTPFADRATVQGESMLARRGTPTTIDRTPYAERATVQGESMLARRGTPTTIDPLSPAERAFVSSPPTSSYATTADDAASLLGRARGAVRTVGEVASAGFKSPLARGVASLPVAAVTAAMELEKYLDPRGKTFTDDIEMMYEGVNENRDGAPSPVSYADIKSRDDLASNYRGLLGAVTGNLGTATGGDVTMSRLTSIGGAPEVFQLVARGLLDKNFLRDAVGDMSQEQRAKLFTYNLNTSPDVFSSVYDALGGNDAYNDIEDYKRYAVDSGSTTAEKNIKRLTDAGVLPGKSTASSTAAPAKPAAAASTARSGPGRVLEDTAITAEAPKKPRSKDSDSNILRAGARGANVAEVQKKLSALGALTPGVEFDLGEIAADGIYGDKTVAAVKKFQSISGIKTDGVVGPETRAALDKALGSVSDAKSPEILAKTEAAPTRSVKTSPVRFDMNQFSDENIDEAVGDPIEPPQIASDRDAPTENTQAYLDLGLDVRPSAFPMFRGRRNRK